MRNGKLSTKEGLLFATYDLFNIDGANTPQRIIDALSFIFATYVALPVEHEEILYGLYCLGTTTKPVMDDFDAD